MAGNEPVDKDPNTEDGQGEPALPKPPAQVASAADVPTLKIAIIGAGPVGLAAAAAMRSLEGVDASVRVTVDVYDSNKAWGDDGWPANDWRALEMWPNARNALKQIPSLVPERTMDGFWDIPGQARGYDLERYDFRAASGQQLWAVPTGALGRKVGSTTRVVTMKQLGAAMREGANAYREDEDAPVSPYVKVLKIDADAAKDAINPGDKQHQIGGKTYDLILVASAQAVDRPPKRRFRDLAIVGYTPGKPPEACQKGSGFVTHADDARFGAWACPETPDQATRWLAFMPAADLFHPSDFDHASTAHRRNPVLDKDGLPIETAFMSGGAAHDWLYGNEKQQIAPHLALFRDRVHKRLRRFHLTAQKLVAGTDLGGKATAPKLQVFALADRRPNEDDWRDGTIVFLGEAAHPMLPDLGQACAMAFEDLVVLRAQLAKFIPEWAKDPARMKAGGRMVSTRALERWLDKWVRARFDRVAEVTQMTRAAAEASNLDGGMPGVRDALMARMGPPMMLPGMTRLMEYEYEP